MKNLELTLDPKFLRNHKNNDYNLKFKTSVALIARKNKSLAATKTKAAWFDKDAPQNLTGKEAAIRGILVVCMPTLSAIDWYLGTQTMIFIAPMIMYLAVTALTMTCPIKAVYTKYRNAKLSEL